MTVPQGGLAAPGHNGSLGGVRRLVVVASVLALGIALGMLPPALGLAVVGGLAAVLLGVWGPVWAVALPLAVIPLELFVFDLGPVGLGPVQIAVIVAVVMMLVEMLSVGRFETPKTPLDVWVMVWLAVGFLGAIGAYDPAGAIKKAGMAVIFAAFFYLVVAKVRTTEQLSRLMGVFTTSCAIVGTYGVWLSYRYLNTGMGAGKAIIVGSEGLAVPRAGSTLGQPTVLAALMVVALPIAMGLVLNAKGLRRIGAALVTAAIIVTLGFTFTRGAWLGAVAGLVVLALDKRARRLLVVLLLLLVVLAPPVVFERAASSTDVGRMEISHRFDFWRGSVLVAEKHPLFGAGIGNYRYNYSRLDVPETALVPAQHPHNLALDLLADTGVIGLMAFGALMVIALSILLRRRLRDPDPQRRLWRLAIAASIVGTLAHQTTDSLLLEPTWNTVMWVLLALAVTAGLSTEAEIAPSGTAAA